MTVMACAPRTIGHGPTLGPPRIETTRTGEPIYVAADGYRMPVRIWRPAAGKARAVIVALHGMNDYSFSFDLPGRAWAEAGIATYAYDQRGFGANRDTGKWPGTNALVRDLRGFVHVVQARNPGLPLYVTGVSMGGAVVMAALDGAGLPEIEGAILVAPAVWGRATIPLLYRIPLTLTAYTVPYYKVTGRGIRRQPTDNIDAWRATASDPKVLKGARADALWGVVNIMDRAYAAAPRLSKPVLLLYGAKDEIIPRKPVANVIARLPAGRSTVAIYPNGWHWLYRDKQRGVVHGDVVAWIGNRTAPLPSGADRNAGGTKGIATRRAGPVRD